MSYHVVRVKGQETWIHHISHMRILAFHLCPSWDLGQIVYGLSLQEDFIEFQMEVKEPWHTIDV